MRRRFFNNRKDNIPLSFYALEDGLSVSLECYDGVWYNINDGDWAKLKTNEYTPEVKKGDTISFKNVSGFLAGNQLGLFSIKKQCAVFGNCGSLLPDIYKWNYISPGIFYRLFFNCTTIIDASSLILPAMTLAERCYGSMFEGCTSLVNAPELPATTLAISCYSSMFLGCTSLVNAPELPATTLAPYCYAFMFYNCTSLVNAPELPVTTLAVSCYQRMFDGCTSLVNAPALPATTLANKCYGAMFSNCTSLVNAPALPATTLASDCYYYMFTNCSNLNYIKMLATDISAGDCLHHWVYGVAPTGTFVKSKDATWEVVGNDGVPAGWKIEYDHNYDIGSDISFHIERIDEKLYAKDWMTWDDWVHSKYNTVSALISRHEILIDSYSSYPLMNTYSDNIIKNGGTYYFKNSGGSSD